MQTNRLENLFFASFRFKNLILIVTSFLGFFLVLAKGFLLRHMYIFMKCDRKKRREGKHARNTFVMFVLVLTLTRGILDIGDGISNKVV